MPYNSNYLSCVTPHGGLSGSNLWFYTTTDNAATIAGAGYFSDGIAKGMGVNDVVIVTQVTALPNTTPTGISVYVVSAVTATAATVIKTGTA
jgi:hypothetical protein